MRKRESDEIVPYRLIPVFPDPKRVRVGYAAGRKIGCGCGSKGVPTDSRKGGIEECGNGCLCCAWGTFHVICRFCCPIWPGGDGVRWQRNRRWVGRCRCDGVAV